MTRDKQCLDKSKEERAGVSNSSSEGRGGSTNSQLYCLISPPAAADILLLSAKVPLGKFIFNTDPPTGGAELGGGGAIIVPGFWVLYPTFVEIGGREFTDPSGWTGG